MGGEQRGVGIKGVTVSDIIYGQRGAQVTFTPNFRFITILLKILDNESEGGIGEGRKGHPTSFIIQGVYIVQLSFTPNLSFLSRLIISSCRIKIRFFNFLQN